MASVLSRVPVEEISARARAAHPLRAFLTFVAAVLFGLGWVVAKAAGAVWFAAAWCWSAVVVGWADARRTGDG